MMTPENREEILAEEIRRIVSGVQPASDGKAVAVLLIGGVGSGKTMLRKERYRDGYVLIDAVDIFLSLSQGKQLEFPGALLDPMELVGSTATLMALSENRPIVTELIGADKEQVIELIEALKTIGYKVQVIEVKCSIEEAIQRNESRGPDDISAYYAGPFQTRWIISACRYIQANIHAVVSLPQAGAMHSILRVYEDADYLLFNKKGLLGITHPFLTSFYVQVKSRELTVKVTGKEKRFLLAIVGEMTSLGMSPHLIKETSVFRDFCAAVPTRGGALWQVFFQHSTARDLAHGYANI